MKNDDTLSTQPLPEHSVRLAVEALLNSRRGQPAVTREHFAEHLSALMGAGQNEGRAACKTLAVLSGLTLEDSWLEAALAELVKLLADPSELAFSDASALMDRVRERKVDILYRIATERLQFAEALTDLVKEVQTLSQSLGLFSGSMDKLANEALTCTDPNQTLRILQDTVYESRQVSARVKRMRNAMHDAEDKLVQATEAAQVLRHLHAEEATAAETDPLTGLLNRRGFDRRLESAAPAPYAVLVLDIDQFKRINDCHGHPVGDQVIESVARTIRDCVRSRDLTVRYGGEEFVAWLPEATLARARVVAERIRQACEQLTFAGYPSLRVTLSAGIAWSATGLDAIGGVLANADQALLAAKVNGRNKVLAMGDFVA